MSNIVDFNRARDKRVKTSHRPTSNDPVDQMLENDIENLAKATGVSKQEAILVASRFYKLYPMLMEYVRSPEYMLRK